MLKFAWAICVVVGMRVGIEQVHASDDICQATSDRMLNDLDTGDYVGATTDFNQRMKAALSAEQLARIWPAIAQQFGARSKREQARLDHVQGHVVVITPLRYGKQLVDTRVACDDDGKVAGFHINPQH